MKKETKMRKRRERRDEKGMKRQLRKRKINSLAPPWKGSGKLKKGTEETERNDG